MKTATLTELERLERAGRFWLNVLRYGLLGLTAPWVALLLAGYLLTGGPDFLTWFLVDGAALAFLWAVMFTDD